MLKLFLCLAIYIFLDFSTASAEYCDMIGGSGDILWIHVPKSQLTTDKVVTVIDKSPKDYKIDRSMRLFVKDGIPNVNDIVVLNTYIADTNIPDLLQFNNCSNDPFLGEEEAASRWKIIQEVDQRPLIYHEDGKAEINSAAYHCTHSGGRRGCWDLNAGAKLKILNYTLIKGVLFALIYVVDC